jgi:hypothetical protein
MTSVPIVQEKQKWGSYSVLDNKSLDQLYSSPKSEMASRHMIVYNVFIAASMCLAFFFTISLILSFATNYFLDWGSALVGLLGTAGLSVVAWLSKKEAQT